MFQSTHSRGVRHRISVSLACVLCFNPRTHEECDVPTIRMDTPQLCFNPRTHEECDPTGEYEMSNLSGVSIHALTRSATAIRIKLEHISSFNPRTHEECDPAKIIAFITLRRVSIHALTRSATKRKSGKGQTKMFQSTHSRGVRHISAKQQFNEGSFNPRTHEECDN